MKQNDETLVSELRYALDINIINHPEIDQLVRRYINEIQRLHRENKEQYAKISKYTWEKYPDRMGQ